MFAPLYASPTTRLTRVILRFTRIHACRERRFAARASGGLGPCRQARGSPEAPRAGEKIFLRKRIERIFGVPLRWRGRPRTMRGVPIRARGSPGVGATRET